MKLFLALLFAGLLMAGSTTYQFDNASTITIDGTSNVRGWSCEASQMAGTLEGQASEQSLSAVTGVRLTIPVQGIECGNGQMNSKVRESLNASQNATIRFTLRNAEVGAPDAQGNVRVNASGQLSIAGVERSVRVVANGTPAGNGRFRLTGEVPVKMSDYGISPPTAMLGALRTADDVMVAFDVIVRR